MTTLEFINFFLKRETFQQQNREHSILRLVFDPFIARYCAFTCFCKSLFIQIIKIYFYLACPVAIF